ncbi:lipoprotein LpqH [Antrihabitans sp. YC2-6]|uniref:lipoprotein LpqH n=1 Tax=Antrihabitans sp. YC2-6 TaxID=2799498 RepID=UPI0018F64251|nr:lipoprotein LpqH [Antrihabitans sp. YC2-6]MBJ8346579.1 lipoprotein LpqH [Antrihabitans sp. YC2-6]
MRKINRVSATLAAATAALALLVTACSDDSDVSTPTANTPATSDSASVASVDGKAIDGKFDTTCAKQGGTLALALADLDNGTYGNLGISATLTGDDTVTAVAIGGTKGGSNGLPYAIGYSPGVPGGSATVTKDGNTYKVTGEGVGTPDPTNLSGDVPSAKFEITFACSTIVGG